MPFCRNLKAATGGEHGDHITQISAGIKPCNSGDQCWKEKEQIGGDLDVANQAGVEATCREMKESS